MLILNSIEFKKAIRAVILGSHSVTDSSYRVERRGFNILFRTIWCNFLLETGIDSQYCQGSHSH
jgi:hypothetical protein